MAELMKQISSDVGDIKNIGFKPKKKKRQAPIAAEFKLETKQTQPNDEMEELARQISASISPGSLPGVKAKKKPTPIIQQYSKTSANN